MNIKDLMSEKMVVALIGVVLVGVSFVYLGKNEPSQSAVASKQAPAGQQADPGTTSKINALEKELEKKLATNLQQMEGVGKVQVSVSLATGLKSEFARNQNTTKKTSRETDKAGGIRETTEVTENDQVVMVNGTAQPVVVMEDRPEVAGVLIIAEGAKDPRIKESIHGAIRTLLNVPASKVIVTPMGGV